MSGWAEKTDLLCGNNIILFFLLTELCVTFESNLICVIFCALLGCTVQYIEYLQAALSDADWSSCIPCMDLTQLLTSLICQMCLGTQAFGCQTATISTWAALAEWLSDPGLSLFSDTAACLFWRAQCCECLKNVLFISSLCVLRPV